MSKTTYHSQFQCYSPHNENEQLSVKKSFDSIISIYNPENELIDMNQEKKGFSQLFDEYGYVVFRNEDFEKQKFIQNFDDGFHESMPYDISPQTLDGESVPLCISPQNLDDESIPSVIKPQNDGCYESNPFSPQNQFKSQISIPQPENIVEKHTMERKFPDKNFCRYILLYIFRTIENKQYEEIISNICSQFQVNYKDFVQYYSKQRVLIIGYQALKKELIYNDDDSIRDQNRKKAFKEVLVWYLNKLATKQILSSKKQKIKDYIKFKNYVMLYNIHNPKGWTGNKIQWN
ncbi:unnamed protein product [Paramecium octaurelia]|uniref:Uncharacterized protein n=1 Tax=Paramecium octaurelia TaxID=43137 RepID=A0A8S1WHQ5_PAROT|nr:unnamed protein product [Paramecium octaurelia]